MKVLVISDTHRRSETYMKVMEQEKDIDVLIHCGDLEGCEYVIEKTAGCELHMVAGNNDYFSDLPDQEEFMLGKYKVWLTHGHDYYVSMDTDRIKQEAVSRGVDIVMFGHTHKPLVKFSDGVMLLNPGSLTYPRQAGRRPTYVVLEIDDDGTLKYDVHEL